MCSNGPQRVPCMYGRVGVMPPNISMQRTALRAAADAERWAYMAEMVNIKHESISARAAASRGVFSNRAPTCNSILEICDVEVLSLHGSGHRDHRRNPEVVVKVRRTRLAPQGCCSYIFAGLWPS